MGLADAIADKAVARAQNLLTVYGPYNDGVEYFIPLITDLVYYTAEGAYFAGNNVQAFVTPFRAERMGSYSYDKGSRQNSFQSIIEDYPVVLDLLLHLKYAGDYFTVGTRIVHQLAPNPDTGVQEYVDSYNNRLQRAIERQNLVSDTEQFNILVYGDSGWGWG
jgi:hypothetical protein